jgi:membrane protein
MRATQPKPRPMPAGVDGAWRTVSEAFRAARNRLDDALPGRVWRELNDLGFISSSLQFAAVFTIGFIPFLMAMSAVYGSGRPIATLIPRGLGARADHDVTMLFNPGQPGIAGLSVITLVLAVLGGSAIAHMLQAWYTRIFQVEIRGWKARARRAEWLAGVFGFVALQVVIGRKVPPLGGHPGVAGAQFLLALAFWWWSLHCLLSGQIPWRRLFRAGLATAVCYTGLGVYVSHIASSSIVSNEAMYGPIGAVIVLLTSEIGLGVALHLGAVTGAVIERAKSPAAGSPGPEAASPAIPGRAGALVLPRPGQASGESQSAPDQSITVQVRQAPGYTAVTVAGEVDIATVPELRDRLATLTSRRAVVIDLNHVTFIDAAGLGALAAAAGRALGCGGSLRVVCSQRHVRRLLAITGLDRQIPVARTLDDALPGRQAPNGWRG